MGRQDRRLDRRLEVEFPVLVVGTGGHRVSRAHNLSSGGVLLERELDSLERGSDFDLDLWLPGAPSAVGCAGTVVYAHGPVAGVKFTSVPDVGQMVIDAFIAARLDQAG